MALRQQFSQKLEQRLSPQQIQLMKLLQVPTMELDQRIKQEIEENPALEEGKNLMMMIFRTKIPLKKVKERSLISLIILMMMWRIIKPNQVIIPKMMMIK